MDEPAKMSLRGESPWGDVIERYPDGTAKLRIINRLFHEYSEMEQARSLKQEWGKFRPLPKLHIYKQGDEVHCRMVDGRWRPIADGDE